MARMTFKRWLKKFEADARADDYLLMDELSTLAVGDSGLGGIDLVEGTIELVAWLANYELCGPDYLDDEVDALLRMQCYDPRHAAGTEYVIVVQYDLARAGPGRVISDRPDFTDLADFHYSHELSELLICRADGKDIHLQQHKKIIKAIENDIYHDYGDEIKIEYEQTEKALRASVHDANLAVEEVAEIKIGLLVEFTRGKKTRTGSIVAINADGNTVEVNSNGKIFLVRVDELLAI